MNIIILVHSWWQKATNVLNMDIIVIAYKYNSKIRQVDAKI